MVSDLRCIMTAVAIDNLSRGNSLVASGSVETDSLYGKVVGVVVKGQGSGTVTCCQVISVRSSRLDAPGGKVNLATLLMN